MIRKLKNRLATLRNAVDYPLRRRIPWRWPIKRVRNESKDNLFASLSGSELAAAQTTAARLKADYRLDSLFAASTRRNYRENLYYLEMLEKAFVRVAYLPAESMDVADVGPSHWFYVQALSQLLRWWKTAEPRTVNLHGFEIDPYRVYADFHSRIDHASAHMQGLAGVEYHPVGIQNQARTFDLVLQLFPFVFIEDHLDWGLPNSMFSPQSLFKEVWGKLKPGGLYIVVNQGEAEHDAQKRILTAAGISPAAAFRHDSRLFAYDLPRYVLAAVKHGDPD